MPDDMNIPIRVLELRSVRGTGGGPEKTILLGAARSDASRYAVTVCYIRDMRDSNFGPRTKALELPVDYLEVCERHSFDPGIVSKIRKILRSRNIDIVHAHDYKTDLLAALLAKTDSVIPLSTAHGWTGHTRREQIYYWADKVVLRKFPKIIAVSTQIRNELVKNGVSGNTIEVILNGINPQSFVRDQTKCAEARKRLDLPLDKIIIGSVGRLEPQKNYDLLLDAFADLQKDNKDLFLAIAGYGSLCSHLESRAHQLDIEENCKFLGHQADVSLVHHTLDIYVQSSDYEGTANSVLEAMALETPIIATDAGGTAELIRDGVDGIIIPPRNKTALCSALKQILGNKESAHSRSVSARRRVETDLSFENRMRKVESIYESLMNGAPDVRSTHQEVRH